MDETKPVDELSVEYLVAQLGLARYALVMLVDAVAGDQRDPEELAKALGRYAPAAIDVADNVVEGIDRLLSGIAVEDGE